MTETPGSASSEETRGGAPEIIYLPDQRQRTKKVTSGSGNRRRKNVERFRTDDAEHLALEALVQANGGSLGAYVMQLAAIDSEHGQPTALKPSAGFRRYRGVDAGPGRAQSRRQ